MLKTDDKETRCACANVICGIFGQIMSDTKDGADMLVFWLNKKIDILKDENRKKLLRKELKPLLEMKSLPDNTPVYH